VKVITFRQCSKKVGKSSLFQCSKKVGKSGLFLEENAVEVGPAFPTSVPSACCCTFILSNYRKSSSVS